MGVRGGGGEMMLVLTKAACQVWWNNYFGGVPARMGKLGGVGLYGNARGECVVLAS